LVKAYDTAIEKIDIAKGRIFNVGGGHTNTLSVWSDFGPILEKLFGRKLSIKMSDWRPGDQKVYISDISKIKKELGWSPTIDVRQGIEKLYHWVQDNKELFKEFK
jgi:CDP-paratose 2-epimerase